MDNLDNSNLQRRIEELEKENEKLRQKDRDRDFKQAAKDAKTASTQTVSTRSDDHAREIAVQKVGGNALFHKLSIQKRMSLLGFDGEIGEADKADAAALFGPAQDSHAMNELHIRNHTRYRFLRALARELGIR